MVDSGDGSGGWVLGVRVSQVCGQGELINYDCPDARVGAVDWAVPRFGSATGVRHAVRHRRPLVRAEIARIGKLLISAPDKATVTYEMARTWAAAKQWPEAIQWLQKATELNAGIDPLRDSLFADLHGVREFEEILATVRRATPVVSHSSSVFKIAEGDLVPESMAYDAKGKHFYFGSMKKGKVVRCSPSGDCMLFADGLGTVLGLKAHGDGLWVLSNSDTDSTLIHYDLASARMVRRYSVAGSRARVQRLGHRTGWRRVSDRHACGRSVASGERRRRSDKALWTIRVREWNRSFSRMAVCSTFRRSPTALPYWI